MKTGVQQGEEKIIWLLRMSLILAAILYIVFGFFMKHVLDIEDLIPLTHRLFIAACLVSLVGLSFISLFVRQYMGLFVYGVGAAAVLHMLYLGIQTGFDAGSIVALILVIPVMNFLLFRWKYLLYANALLLIGIVLVYTASDPSFIEIVLFILSSAVISGVSFWFTRQLLLFEKKADDSEQLFFDLFHYSMEGIAIYEFVLDGKGDPIDYIFLRANTMFEKHIGLEVKEILGKKITEILPGIEETRIFEKYGQVVYTGQAITFEHFFETRQRHYRITAYPMRKDRIATAFADITKQKKDQEDLQEKNEFIQKIMKSLPNAVIYVFDLMTQKNIYMSKSLGDVLGYTPEEFQGMGEMVLKRLIHPDDYGLFMDHLAMFETLHKDDIIQFEYRMRHRNGDWIWIENRDSILVDDASGKPLQLIGSAVDVTERKIAEQKLVEYTEELERRGSEMDALYNTLDTEMQSARRAHQRLVQQRLPQIEGLSLAMVHSPATFIGGDFSYVIRKGDLLILYVSDITGHGLEGTIFGLFVKGCIESYLELVSESEIVPDKILTYLDGQVHKGRYPSEYAVAIFMMVTNVVTRETTFSAAGFQNPPVLVHNNGSLEMLVSQGLPISPDIPSEVKNFEHHSTHLPKNAFLLVATDGLYEQYSGEEMYEQRFLDLLKECSGLPKDTIADLVYRDFCDFRGKEEQSDDVTYVVLSTESFEEHSLPSSFDSLYTLREYVLAYYRDHFLCEAIAVAAHELVANSIEHGNQFDDDKSVRLLFSSKAVVVEDEGDGFDWRTRIERDLDLYMDSERGRGIPMVQILVGDLVYNRKGNRASVILRGKEV